MRDKDTRNSRTVRRIRTSPDLLVYDEKRKDAMLVEIKMRRALKETSVKYLRMANYKEFWNDSILVVLVPSGNVFYAQRVSELEIKQTYDARKDFERFEDIFTSQHDRPSQLPSQGSTDYGKIACIQVSNP